MAAISGFAMAMLVFVFIGAVSTIVESAVPCSEVQSELLPCAGYAQNGGAVPAACCDGVKKLKAEAVTAEDRQNVCNCIKSLAKQVVGLREDLLASIPEKCGVDIGYTMSFSVDCSKVK